MTERMSSLVLAQELAEYWKAEHADACAEIERLKQRDRDYRDTTSGCPDVLISRELLTKSFDKLYREKALRERVAELEGLCRQLYEAERDKNQKDWTAVIQALEKVGADSTALERPNVK